MRSLDWKTLFEVVPDHEIRGRLLYPEKAKPLLDATIEQLKGNLERLWQELGATLPKEGH
jgi:hypothetical protein